VLDIYSSLSLIWRYSYCPVFQGATSGCSQMVGVEESRKVTGDVLITPELKSDFQGMFTPYLKPGR
ncbi:hypothetical protein LNX43_20840, partial [Klebsiella pneumoniae]|nr:hypothetical protein [Klebsiella pneumoniae]